MPKSTGGGGGRACVLSASAHSLRCTKVGPQPEEGRERIEKMREDRLNRGVDDIVFVLEQFYHEAKQHIRKRQFVLQ